jgi:ATP-binding cassette, subfamily C (CFTR/MRP), member 1
VGIVSSILRSIKSVKLSGLTNCMADLLQEERKRELFLARKFRWMLALTTTIANIPNMLSALVVFALYAIESRVNHTAPLSTAKAFTSLSILILLNTPAASLLNSFPTAIASLGCLKRIQDFLESNNFQDDRATIYNLPSQTYLGDSDIPQVILSVSGVVIKPNVEVSGQSRINFEMQTANIMVILGPTGSGKSSLLKAILGELKPQKGEIAVSDSSFAYCAQEPWLQNGTIRDNILEYGMVDEQLYRKTLWICALDEDIQQMPEKDLSVVGSRGLALSGG